VLCFRSLAGVWRASACAAATRARSGTAAPAGDEDQVTVESRVACGCCVRPCRFVESWSQSSSSKSKPRPRARGLLLLVPSPGAISLWSPLLDLCRATTRPAPWRGNTSIGYLPSQRLRILSNPFLPPHPHPIRSCPSAVPRPVRPKRQVLERLRPESDS
jgi:hypothetical protein